MFNLRILIACLVLHSTSFKLYLPTKPNLLQYNSFHGVEQDRNLVKFPRLHQISERLIIADNTTATLLNLIAFGRDWDDGNQETSVDITPKVKVPGCVSDVRLSVQYDEESEQIIKINGVADSAVALGMLALVSEGLIGCDVHSISLTSVDEALQSCMSIVNLLPRGRLNGLRNIYETVQGITRLKAVSFSDTPSDEPRNSSDTRDQEVAVLLSGGVDSSVALKLLLDQGHRVRAFYLKIWLEDELAYLNECPWEEDLHYAQAVCDQLGVPLETVSLQKEYFREVVGYTIAEARAGRTPNPDIMCNSRIKFGMFYEYVGRHFKKIATGHYAQVRPMVSVDQRGDPIEIFELFASPDPVKDQTYFLSFLRQEQLAKALFPIGHLCKTQVRELAMQFGLPTKARKDSQGICFLGKVKFDQFIEHYLNKNPGEIRDYKTDTIIGRHNGLWFHTIGQRKGVGELLKRGFVNLGPWFVAAKDIKKNVLYITNNFDIVDRSRAEFSVSNVTWIAGAAPTALGEFGGSLELLVKLRHGFNLIPGIATVMNGQAEDRHSLLIIRLSRRDQVIAPGQFAAFYHGDVCLGAGIIFDSKDANDGEHLDTAFSDIDFDLVHPNQSTR